RSGSAQFGATLIVDRNGLRSDDALAAINPRAEATYLLVPMVLSGREFRVVSPSEPREIDFRLLASADLPMLTAWLAEPHVRTFYQKTPVSLEEVALEYGPVISAQEPTLSHLALSQGKPFAYLQCYRNADYPDWAELIKVVDGISIDLFIGDPVYL